MYSFSRLETAVWTGAQMDPLGNWFINEVELKTSDYKDLRRPSKTWIPHFSVLNPNGTTQGCLELTKTGLLNTKIDQDCETDKKPAVCEHKICMTTKGKKCLFPFNYKNETHPVLEYNICSGLDVYR